MTIENFAALSAQEQREFAVQLLAKINAEHIFTTEATFELDSVEPDDFTGGLVIVVSHSDPIEVSRKATWSSNDEDDVTTDPGYDADYENNLTEDAKKAFKTLSTVIDGYNVSLEIDDIDEDETVDIDIDHIHHDDSGIGHYEFWGDTGYDSHPYVEVDGTITKACSMALTLFVEAADNI